MPQITSAAQQHRRQTGEHLAQQDSKQRGQAAQDEYTRKLAQRPGLHGGNIRQQQNAALLLQVASFLTVARNAPTMMAEGAPSRECPPQSTADTINAGEGKFSSTLPQTPYPRNNPHDAFSTSCGSTANTGEGNLPSFGAGLRDALVTVGDFIDKHDPLRFPVAEAAPATDELPWYMEAVKYLPFAPVYPIAEGIIQADKVDPAENAAFSCSTGPKSWNFTEVLRATANTLEKPATHYMLGSVMLIQKIRGEHCIPDDEIANVRIAASVVDTIISFFVPGRVGKAAGVAQDILSPLLTQAANSLDGQPLDEKAMAGLGLQIIMQGRSTAKHMTKAERAILNGKAIPEIPKAKPLIPEFKIKDGTNHVALRVNGKVNDFPVYENRGGYFVKMPGKAGAPEKSRKIIYNHVHRQWAFTGDGKFDRFKGPGMRVAQEYGLPIGAIPHQQHTPKNVIFAFVDSHLKNGEQLDVIELCGRFVPVRRNPVTFDTEVYDLLKPEAPGKRVFLSKKHGWQLEVPENKAVKTEFVFSPKHGKVLEVGVVGQKGGVERWAEYERKGDFFYGPKYVKNHHGQLELKPKSDSQGSVSSPGKQSTAPIEKKRKGNPEELQGHRHRHRHRHGERVQDETRTHVGMDREVAIPGFRFDGKIMKRDIQGAPFVQYYATAGAGSQGSKVLTVVAHGGYIQDDLKLPPVEIPAGMTLKLMTPHGTSYLDNGISSTLNQGSDFRPFVTLNNRNGKTVVTQVDFIPQDNVQAIWRKDKSYDPEAPANTLGRKDGLQDYRLTPWDGDSEQDIGEALIGNRLLADKKKVPKSDILTVSDDVTTMNKARDKGATQKSILDLDRQGKLVNEKGERYNEIVFTNCRVDVKLPPDAIRDYDMMPPPAANDEAAKRRLGRSVGEMTITTLKRHQATQKLEVTEVKYHLVPRAKGVTRQTTSTPTTSTRRSYFKW